MCAALQWNHLWQRTTQANKANMMVPLCADASPTFCLERHQLVERVPVYWHDQPEQAPMKRICLPCLTYAVLARELYLVAPADRI